MGYTVVMAGEDVCHHGIKGQRWGVRRYQNPDGSLTSAGRKRYSSNGTITENGQTRPMTDAEKMTSKKVMDAIQESNIDPDKIPDLGDFLRKTLSDENIGALEIEYEEHTRASKVKSFTTVGKRTYQEELAKEQLADLKHDRRVKVGKAAVDVITFTALAGLTYSYLVDLGIV